jgi:hypothetical protein
MRTPTICTILLVIGVLLLRASTDGVLGKDVEEIEWLESYEAALDEARTHNPPRWVVLILRDDTRWSQELLRRLDHSKEAIHLARTHFVMAQVTEEALPPAARLQFNEVNPHPHPPLPISSPSSRPSHLAWQLAPYAPSAFFIGPDGHVRRDLINKFAPADQVRARQNVVGTKRAPGPLSDVVAHGRFLRRTRCTSTTTRPQRPSSA